MTADNLTIVLVEDDAVDTLAVQRCLDEQRVPHRLHVVRDGLSALGLLRGDGDTSAPEGPIVLLIDLNLPRMNGIELLRELNRDAALRRIPAFALSTSRSPHDVLAAYDENIAGYLVKEDLGSSFERLGELLRAYAGAVLPPVASTDHDS